MAEALRLYMESPALMKARYPGVAARLREYVNESPAVNAFLHLNSDASHPALGMAGVRTYDDERTAPLWP